MKMVTDANLQTTWKICSKGGGKGLRFVIKRTLFILPNARQYGFLKYNT